MMANKLTIICFLLCLTLACILPANITDPVSPLVQSLNQFIDDNHILAIEVYGIETTPENSAESLPDQIETPTLTPTIEPTVQTELTVTPAIEETPTGRIIYTCQVDKNPSHDQICMVNADGTGFTQLTNAMKFQHFYPSWAPDGNSFVFSGAETGIFKLYEMDLNGNMHIIGDISGELYAPMISPDGTKIVFTRHFSESEQYISVCDRDGSNVRNLTGFYDAKDPVWSLDGTKILFTSLQGGTQQLYIMNANGTFKQKISDLSSLRGRTDWSIDLSVVTYVGRQKDHDREVVFLEIGGEPIFLTQGGDNLSPAFSPDGSWIAFMSYRDHFWQADGCELYVMRIDGSDIRRLTTNEYCDYQPRWGQ